MLRSYPTHSRRALAFVAAGASAVVATAACHVPGRGASAPDDVAIGVAFNPKRPGMDEIVRGATLAAESLTRNPAAHAAGLRFVVRQAPARLTSAVEVAQALRDDPAVLGIVGDAESGRTLDALPILEDVEHAGARA